MAQAVDLKHMDGGYWRRPVAKPRNLSRDDMLGLSAAVLPADIKMSAPRMIEPVPAALAGAQHNLPLLDRQRYVGGLNDARHGGGSERLPDSKFSGAGPVGQLARFECSVLSPVVLGVDRVGKVETMGRES